MDIYEKNNCNVAYGCYDTFYGVSAGGLYSIVEVNGQRLTTSAGGQDDGTGENGALITVGGIGDTNDNPANPYATGSQGPRYDDELYNLLPFVESGDSTISVYTRNPSNDDNILFAAFFIGGATAVVGEGIILSPASSSNSVGAEHTVTATVQDSNANPMEGVLVSFEVVSGPHTGTLGSDITDSNGKATFSYTGTMLGTDVIVASFVNSNEQTVISNTATKEWVAGDYEPEPEVPPENEIPEFGIIAAFGILGIAGLYVFRRRKA